MLQRKPWVYTVKSDVQSREISEMLMENKNMQNFPDMAL